MNQRFLRWGQTTQAICLALIITGLLAGCGYKAPPLPKLKPLPEAVVNLSVDQVGTGLLLSWQMPSRNQDSSILTDLKGFTIYRAITEPDNTCLECGDADRPWQWVDLNYLGTTERQGNRFWLLDPGVVVGKAYRYRLFPLNSGGYPGREASIQKVVIRSPSPPTDLRAQGQDRLIRLQWAEPDLRNREKLIGYRVYRSEGEKPLSFRSITPTPLEKTEFLDSGIENGLSYRYGIRTVVKTPAGPVESPLSNPVQAVPTPGQ